MDLKQIKRRTDFIDLALIERLRQNKAWPNTEKRANLSLDRWMSILVEELGEYAQATVDGNYDKALIELAEVVAVCFSIAELSKDLEPHFEHAKIFMQNRADNQKSKE